MDGALRRDRWDQVRPGNRKWTMALALMRQALEWLEAADEDKAAAHLRDAVDTLLKRAPRMDRAAAS